MKTTLTKRFTHVTLAHADRPAIADSSGRQLTYRELLRQAQSLAAWLISSRGGEGRIGLCLPASVSAAIANYAVTLSGKIAVNLNFSAGHHHCRAAIEQCALRTVLTSRAFVNRASIEPFPEMVFLDDIETLDGSHVDAPDQDPDSTACILFSSGSTGVPKGIELTHWNIVANAAGLAARIPPSETDCMLGVLPFFHSFGYTFALWFPVLHGIRAVYHSSPTDAKVIGELASQHRATYFLSTPTFCAQYAAKIERDHFQSLKYILVGAEKLRDSVARTFRDHFGVELLAGYGCTELGPGVAINTPWESRPGSVGRPLDGVEVRIADPQTLLPVRTGEQGVILINGPSRMPGYFGAPQLTAQAMDDGFYITGDLGYVDADGFLYVTDRLARFSKVAGEMVPHLAIEETLSDLTPAFVTGVPDDRRGERLVLLYTNGLLRPEVVHKCLTDSELPRLWIPKREDVHPVPGIPVLSNGKIDLQAARALAAQV